MFEKFSKSRKYFYKKEIIFFKDKISKKRINSLEKKFSVKKKHFHKKRHFFLILYKGHFYIFLVYKENFCKILYK